MAKRKLDKTIQVNMLLGRMPLINGFTRLKNQSTREEIEIVARKFFCSTTKTGEQFRKVLFPETYSKLRTERLVHFTQGSIEKELAWGRALFLACYNVISEFQKERNRFENYVLLGDYEAARECIEKIKKEFGCSLWSMEQEFLLFELQEGLEANKKFLNELNSCLNSAWVKGFAEFFSMKAERNLNIGQYRMRIERGVRRLSEASKTYFKMHLFVEVTVNRIDWKEVLQNASMSSLIDYYIDYCKICSYIICDDNISNHIKEYIKKCAKEISDKFSAPLFEKISFDGRGLYLTETEKEIQKIGALYTTGKYEAVIEYCPKLLMKNANVFPLYEYYIKSCIINGQVSKFSKRNEDNTYLNEKNKECLCSVLMDVLYAVYQKETDFEIAFDEIWVLMRYLNGFSIAPELYNFYLKKVAYYFSDFWKKCLEYQAPYHNMRGSFLYEGITENKYFDLFEKECGKSSIIQLFRNMKEEGVELSIDEVSYIRKEWYHIKKLAKSGQHEEALQLARAFSNNRDPYVLDYLQEELPLFIYETKVQLNKYADALEMLIDIYMNNKYMAMRINKDSLYKQIKENNNADIKKSIAMPILSYIVNQGDSSKIFVDVANFMWANEYNKSSDLFKNITHIDLKRIVFFLRYICTTDILDTMYWAFETQDEVLRERMCICQKLREIDNENESIYIEEIGNITQRQNLSKDIRYLEEQKIDFDMEKIHANYLMKFLENFKRYKEIGKIWQDIQGINIIRDQNLVIYTYIVEDGNTENYSIDKQNQKFHMFSELFCEMRDEAAFGQMGLDESLGTRIRHGRLQNQIRHVFEQNNIIFIKRDDDSLEYIPVNKNSFDNLFDTWNMQQKQKEKLYEIITDFTQTVDNIVYEVNKEYIRIQTENEYPQGVIDLKYTSGDIWELFNLGGDYENAEIMMELFEKSILDRIRVGLQNLSELFRNSIKMRYVQKLNNLEERLRLFYTDINMELEYSRVRSNLIQCRTEIQREMEAISQWFRLPTSQEHPDYYMQDLLETCKATMRNINARYEQAKIQINNKTFSLWKGRTFSYFNEILIILFTNAFIHAGYKQNPEELEISLELLEDEYMLEINMLTNLSNEVNVEEVKEKTRLIQEKLLLYTNRVYGKDSGSGYIKIMNMMKNYIVSENRYMLNFGVHQDDNHFFTNLKIIKKFIIGEEKVDEIIADRR